MCPCRFTVELPPGLLERNIDLGNMGVPAQVQNPEQIEAIVKEARMPQPVQMMRPNWVG